MFRWHYLDTDEEQLVISDGITLWVYEPDLEQVFVRQGRSVENSVILKIFGVVDKADQQYVVEELSSPGWLRLRLGADDAILSVDVEYVDTMIKSVRSIDPSGFSTLIEFVNPKTNPRLKASDFQFVPPPDIDTIYDRR
jgi:outer membrane lipoprotein carrier protein